MSAVFIVGAPRSGTTLLQSIVCSHSYFYSLPETSFFSEILPILGVEYFNPNREIKKNAVKVIEENLQLMTGFKVDLCSKISDNMTIRDAFELLVQEFNHEKKKYWVEKTTNHARYMFAIHRFYPDAKFIHIIRDPVAAVGSMMSLRPTSVLDFRISYFPVCYNQSKLWNECVSAAFKYPYQAKVLHIFYENLVLYPYECVQKVCDFLKVPFEEKMLNSFHDSSKNIISVTHCPWQKDNLVSGFHVDAVHKWRKKLSPYLVWLIQQNTDDLCRYLGYYAQINAGSKTKKMLYIILDLAKLIISYSGIERIIRHLIGNKK